MSFILYAGPFLFSSGTDRQKNGASAAPGLQPAQNSPADEKTAADAVEYLHKSEQINGLKQEINILTIDPTIPGIRIQPVLSHDVIYGFEPLSAMAARKNACAAVNGGFFSKYGLPSGMVVKDGELISAATGKYPVFLLQNGKASLMDFKSNIDIEYGNSSSQGNIRVDCYNAPAGAKSVAVYTPYYGQTNRASKPNLSLTVENGKVAKLAFYEKETEIPRDGFLVSFFDTGRYSPDNLPIRRGDSIRLTHAPELSAGTAAYECGAWLVRGGRSVAPEKDAWVGTMMNRDPRTAVGIRSDGRVILLTVDGRQPGYSAGFTGQELAAYLIRCGATDAAMLDGGASTEMLFRGKLVSRPSYKGEERTLGGGILVLSGD